MMHGPMLRELGWPNANAQQCLLYWRQSDGLSLHGVAPCSQTLKGRWCCLQALIRKYMPVAVVIAILLFVFLIRRWLYT